MIIKRSITLNLLLPVMIALYLYLSMNLFAWVIDDLYIYFRYVDNFISGNGIAFNKGEHVEGFSSFLWFMYLSLCGAINLPLEAAAKYTGLAISVVNALLTYKISSHIFPGRFALIAPAMMMFSLPYMLWSVSGFEIMLCIFLILLSAFIVLTKNSKRYMILLSVLLFMLCITRPEGILTAVAIFAYMYFFREMRSELKFPSLLFISMLLLFLIFRFFYFGDILPNTYYAKIGHGLIGSYELRSYKNGLMYFIFFLKSNPQFIPAIMFSAFIIFKAMHNRIMILFVMLLACQLIFMTFSGGDWMVQYRFAVPAIPLLAIITAGFLQTLAGAMNQRTYAASTVAILLCLITAISLKYNDYSVIHREITLWNNLKSISPSMNEVISKGSLAASGACGIMPYFMSDVKFIDMVGLTNREIARNGYRSGIWFERSLPGYVYSLKPEWLIMWKKSNNGGEYLFRNAAPVYHEMSLDPGFADYELNKTFDVLNDVKIEFYKLKGI